MEQLKLRKCNEIHNLPLSENENLIVITGNIAKKPKQNAEHIKQVNRLSGRGDRPGLVQIEFKTEENKASRITASKSKSLDFTGSVTIPEAHSIKSSGTLFICEALIPYKKTTIVARKTRIEKYVQIHLG